MAYDRIVSRGNVWIEDRAFQDANIALVKARAQCDALKVAMENAVKVIATLEKERRDLMAALIAQLSPAQAMSLLEPEKGTNENPG